MSAHHQPLFYVAWIAALLKLSYSHHHQQGRTMATQAHVAVGGPWDPSWNHGMTAEGSVGASRSRLSRWRGARLRKPNINHAPTDGEIHTNERSSRGV